MGSISKSKGDLNSSKAFWPEKELYSKKREDTVPEVLPPAMREALAKKAPAQTDAKARLIEDYIRRFQMVTGGGLYIDGFAAPQKRDKEDAWTARRVLEIKPKRLRRFWLCDVDPRGVEQLKELKAKHHNPAAQRRVVVYEGDFNRRVDEIIKSGRIKRRSAVFAFLDQRNTECHWATVQKLAAHEGRTKIEMLYFLGVGWLIRSLKTSSTPKRLSEIDQWWGGPGWRDLKELTQTEISEVVSKRFQNELGYTYATGWPIFLEEDSTRKAFVLIHATDHPLAPKLMSKAFHSIYGDRAGTPTDTQGDLFE